MSRRKSRLKEGHFHAKSFTVEPRKDVFHHKPGHEEREGITHAPTLRRVRDPDHLESRKVKLPRRALGAAVRR